MLELSRRELYDGVRYMPNAVKVPQGVWLRSPKKNFDKHVSYCQGGGFQALHCAAHTQATAPKKQA